MFALINIAIIAVLGISIFWYYAKNKKQLKVDYSFGLVEAKNSKAFILQENYEAAESIILNLNPDNLTQTIDYLGLTLDENVFIKWLDKTKNEDVVRLCLGVHYLHKAWIARTHATADNVSEESAAKFFEYQELSLEELSSVDNSSKLIAETYSRMIRLSMGMGDSESVHTYFQKAIAKDKAHFWAYLSYCEAIEPKWGGKLNRIADFQKKLPDVPIIKFAVELKLILDSLRREENYFGGTVEELNVKAKKEIERIDKEITLTPLTSIHKYVVYGYLYQIADIVSNEQIEKKYEEMIGGNYALYPFGINI